VASSLGGLFPCSRSGIEDTIPTAATVWRSLQTYLVRRRTGVEAYPTAFSLIQFGIGIYIGTMSSLNSGVAELAQVIASSNEAAREETSNAMIESALMPKFVQI
jgi:hypothetical protein